MGGKLCTCDGDTLHPCYGCQIIKDIKRMCGTYGITYLAENFSKAEFIELAKRF
jgi:hypothetical protein